MITPNIRYYAKMEDCTGSGKIPKYVITTEAGYYPPMEKITGRDGKVSMKLQAKNSLNFTGLKEYFINGKLSGYAYGYPLADKNYSKDKKSNPFFEYRDDGFLFIIHQDKTATTTKDQIKPDIIELIVLEGAKVLIASYCKQLMIGGFDEAIKALREQAKRVETQTR